jgi:hypothetical protein
MATGTITDKINNVVALLIDQCYCETSSEIKAAFQELQAALNAQLRLLAVIQRQVPAIAARHGAGNTAKSSKSEIWLMRQSAANQSAGQIPC